jgi:cell shape-determining protein MreD
MSYFIYIVSSLCLVTLQTALIPRLGFVGHFFDLLLPWVIYLAAFRPVHEALPFVVFMGALMDNLSGGPFGLFLTSYVWLYIAVRLAATVVRAENAMVLVLIIIAAVVFQNTFFFMAINMSLGGGHTAGEVIRVVSEQIGWVLLTGPLIALGMRQAKRRTSRRTRTVVERQAATRDG